MASNAALIGVRCGFVKLDLVIGIAVVDFVDAMTTVFCTDQVIWCDAA
jgi:hypothetical protein